MTDGKVARRCEPMEGRDKEAKEKVERKEKGGKKREGRKGGKILRSRGSVVGTTGSGFRYNPVSKLLEDTIVALVVGV